MSLTPEDFKFTLLDEARRLRVSVIARTSQLALDSRTSMWVIRLEGWRELLRAADYDAGIVHQLVPTGTRKELMGLPVRVTVDDEPDVPMIQLVMEPQLAPRP